MQIKRIKWSKSISLILALGLAAPHVHASIPDRVRSIDLKVTPIYPVQSTIIKETVEDYFPTSLSPTTDQKAVVLQFQNGVSQRVLDRLFSGEYFKETKLASVASLATTVQEITHPSMEVSEEPTGFIQTINFDFQAFQGVAAMTLEGWWTSNLTYYINENAMLTQISKPLSDRTTLSLSNRSPVGQFNPEGNLSLTYIF